MQSIYLVGYTEDKKFKVLFRTGNYRMAVAKGKMLAQKLNRPIEIKRKKEE